MAQHFTITADLNALTGSLDLSRRLVVVTSNLPPDAVVVDKTNKKLHVGTGEFPIPADGVVVVSLLESDAADTNVTGIEYWLETETILPSVGNRGRRSKATPVRLGPFKVTKNANLADADMVAQFETPATSPSWRDGFKTEMEAVKELAQTVAAAEADRAEAAADAAVDISGIVVDDDIVEALIKNTGGAGPKSVAALNAAYAGRFTPEAYGAVGNGVEDDTAAVRAMAEAANAKARTGLSATLKHPGATVALAGRYNLATLAAPIDFMCNVESNRATFIVPAAYAGVAVRVGNVTSGHYLQAADISLPDVVKPNGSALVAGSVGVRTINIGDSDIRFGRVAYFETAHNYSGDGQGTAYNTIALGWIQACKVSVSLKPHTASGWCNQNTFIGGSVQQSVSYSGGIRQAGYRHVVLDGSPGNYVNGNIFLGTSFEGDVSEYWLYAKSAADNHFINTRHEQGTLGVAVTVSGDTLTKTAHGFAVGDMVTFNASSTPGGMLLASPYFVVEVPTADTIKVSRKKAGAAVTFTTAGSGVVYFRPPRAYFDLGGTILQNITIEKAMTQQGIMEIVRTSANGSNLVYERPGWHTRDTFNPEDIPLYRARNSSGTAATRAVFAAYGQTVNPVDDPLGWGAALSDYGVVWGASGSETGRLGNAGGVMQYRRPADSVAFEVASCRRASTPTTITALSLASGITTSTTITLTGASPNDYVIIQPAANLPSGVLIAYARVSAANTITIGFLNTTASTVSLTADVQPMVIRRYY